MFGAQHGIQNTPFELIERKEGMETKIENLMKCFDKKD